MKKHAKKDREERREERPRATGSRRDEREQSPVERSRRAITGGERPRERSRLGRSTQREDSNPREYSTPRENRTSASWYPERSRFTLNLRSQSRRLSPRSRHDEGIYSY